MHLLISFSITLFLSLFSFLLSSLPTINAQPHYWAAPINPTALPQVDSFSSSPLLYHTSDSGGIIDNPLSDDPLALQSHRWSSDDEKDEYWDLPDPVHPPIPVDSFMTQPLRNGQCGKHVNYDNINNNDQVTVLNRDSVLNALLASSGLASSDDSVATSSLASSASLDSDDPDYEDSQIQQRRRPRRPRRPYRPRRPRRPGRPRRGRPLPPTTMPPTGRLLIGFPQPSARTSPLVVREACQRSCSERVISIEGRGISSIKPDWIELKMAIERRIKTGREEDRRIIKAEIPSIDRIKSSLQSFIHSRLLSIYRYLLSYPSSIIPRPYIRITSFRLEPEYVQIGPGKGNRLNAYRVSIGLTIRIKVDEAMKIITQLLKLGITRIDGISYISDSSLLEKARKEALKRAVNDAFRQVDQFVQTATLPILISKWQYNQTIAKQDLLEKNTTDQELFHYGYPYQIISASITRLTDPPARPLQVSIMQLNEEEPLIFDQSNNINIDQTSNNDTINNDTINDTIDDNDHSASFGFESLLLLENLLNDGSMSDDSAHGRLMERVSLLQGELREIGAAITIRVRF